MSNTHTSLTTRSYVHTTNECQHLSFLSFRPWLELRSIIEFCSKTEFADRMAKIEKSCAANNQSLVDTWQFTNNAVLQVVGYNTTNMNHYEYWGIQKGLPLPSNDTCWVQAHSDNGKDICIPNPWLGYVLYMPGGVVKNWSNPYLNGSFAVAVNRVSGNMFAGLPMSNGGQLFFSVGDFDVMCAPMSYLTECWSMFAIDGGGVNSSSISCESRAEFLKKYPNGTIIDGNETVTSRTVALTPETEKPTSADPVTTSPFVMASALGRSAAWGFTTAVVPKIIEGFALTLGMNEGEAEDFSYYINFGLNCVAAAGTLSSAPIGAIAAYFAEHLKLLSKENARSLGDALSYTLGSGLGLTPMGLAVGGANAVANAVGRRVGKRASEWVGSVFSSIFKSGAPSPSEEPAHGSGVFAAAIPTPTS